jgi:hypothetical protein
MPPEIRALLQAHYASKTDSSGGLTEDDYRRLGQRLSDWMRAAVAMSRFTKHGKQQAPVAEDPLGGVITIGNPHPHEGGTPPDNPPKPLRRSRKKPADQRIVHRDGVVMKPSTATNPYADLPKADFHDPEDGPWTAESWASMDYASSDHRVLLNREHPYYKAFQAALRDKYPEEANDPTLIALIYEAGDVVWRSSAALAVAHQLSLAKEFPEAHEQLVNPTAFTSAMGGVRNQLEVASGPIGKILGNKRRRAA